MNLCHCGKPAGPTGLCSDCFLSRDPREGSFVRPAGSVAQPIHIFTFQRRFVPAIQGRAKVSTIRAIRDRVVEPGDLMDLRTWQGRPYGSPQSHLCVATCQEVDLITLELRGQDLFVTKRGFTLTTPELARLATEDGFASVDEMREWFEAEHKLAKRGRRGFVGTYYRWTYQ